MSNHMFDVYASARVGEGVMRSKKLSTSSKKKVDCRWNRVFVSQICSIW